MEMGTNNNVPLDKSGLVVTRCRYEDGKKIRQDYIANATAMGRAERGVITSEQVCFLRRK
jgi:hypothetical protein